MYKIKKLMKVMSSICLMKVTWLMKTIAICIYIWVLIKVMHSIYSMKVMHSMKVML